MLNMVTSLDGGTALSGGATAITDPDDQALFGAFRGIADVILVGAATVRAENYGPVKISSEVQTARIESGQAPLPRIAVLTRNLNLDPDSRFFSDPAHPPLVFTGSSAPKDDIRILGDSAEVKVGDSPLVDPAEVVSTLAEMGHQIILCEGGPSINGQLLEADLVDEFNISTAPVAIGGNSSRLAHSSAEINPGLEFELDAILAGDRMMFSRYLRSR